MFMLAYAIRRMLVSVPIVVIATFVVFMMVSLSGDPLSELKTRNPPPPRALQLETHRLHLDEPLLARYWHWIIGVFHGDFGPSVQSTQVIGPELAHRFLVTFRLIGVAMLLALVLAVAVGVVSAVKQYSATDYTFTFFGFLFLAMPSFWFAILLKEAGISFNDTVGNQVLFTIGDSSVYIEGGAWASITDIVGHMILPTISLALLSFAAWSRFQRASMLEVLNTDYVRWPGRTPYTLGLLGSHPRLDVRRQRLHPISGAPPLALNLPSGCSFAPRCPLVAPIGEAEEPPLTGQG
jgi:peptide/nickel transport system permease protein